MPKAKTGRYAEGTEVDVSTSRMEIERTLGRYGAQDIAIMLSGSTGVGIIIFVLHDRRVKLEVRSPSDAEYERIRLSKAQPNNYGHAKSRAQAFKLWAFAEERRRWRVCLLRLKAKLEVVEDAASFEREFMPDILLPDNRTVGDTITPMIAQAYETKKNALLLPGLDDVHYTPPPK